MQSDNLRILVLTGEQTDFLWYGNMLRGHGDFVPELTWCPDPDAVGDLLNRLPADQLESSDDPMLQAAAAGDYAALVDLAGDYLLDRLEAGQEH